MRHFVKSNRSALPGEKRKVQKKCDGTKKIALPGMIIRQASLAAQRFYWCSCCFPTIRTDFLTSTVEQKHQLFLQCANDGDSAETISSGEESELLKKLIK